MNDTQIQTIADHVLRPALGPFRYERAEVRTGRDYSDEPAVYVDVVLGVGAPALGPMTLIDAHVALSRALIEGGEERFPYLRTKRLQGHAPGGGTLEPARGRS